MRGPDPTHCDLVTKNPAHEPLLNWSLNNRRIDSTASTVDSPIRDVPIGNSWQLPISYLHDEPSQLKRLFQWHLQMSGFQGHMPRARSQTRWLVQIMNLTPSYYPSWLIPIVLSKKFKNFLETLFFWRFPKILGSIDLFNGRGGHCPFEMVLIYQPPNAHVQISWILLCNAMAAAAVKKIYNTSSPYAGKSHTSLLCIRWVFWSWSSQLGSK
jgi:hypothetical protein